MKNCIFNALQLTYMYSVQIKGRKNMISKGKVMFSAQQVVFQSLLLLKISIQLYMCLRYTVGGTIASKISIETATVSWNTIVSNFQETPHAVFLDSFFLSVYFGLICVAKPALRNHCGNWISSRQWSYLNLMYQCKQPSNSYRNLKQMALTFHPICDYEPLQFLLIFRMQ